MGVNKVEYGGETLIDLTSDTVSADTLAEGETAHNAAGEEITGTMKGLPDYSTDNNGQVLTIVDGSPAWETPSYTSDEDILGIWKFIDEPDVDSLSGVDIAFISNDTNFVAMNQGYVGADYFGIKSLNYTYAEGSGYGSIPVYTNNPSGDYGITHGWSNEAYKIIEITEVPTDSAIIEWIMANARKVSLNDISAVDTWAGDVTGLGSDDSCIYWHDEVAFYDEDSNELSRAEISHFVPISAGDGVSFTVENDSVKISASGGGGGGSLDMPQIRFTGAISTASLEGAPYQLSVGYGFGLTVAIIGGGALQVGDRVQVCKVKTKWKKKKSTGAIRVKQCLRCFTETVITEDNINNRCLTVPIESGNDDSDFEFAHNGRKDARKIFPMFMRIKRIMAYNDYGEEYQAKFSNVVQFWVSYNEVAGIHPVSIF